MVTRNQLFFHKYRPETCLPELIIKHRSIHMEALMGFLAPETWFVNKTENTMVVVTEDELGVHVGTELIEPGRHLNMGYRKGIDRIGKIHFWVHPKNRPDLRGPNIMPIDVYDYADIDVVYKLGGCLSGRYQIGALVGFEFKKDTMFGRIGLVRWCGGACASLASLGNCYHAPPTAPHPVPVHAIGHVQALAPALPVVAQVPDPSLAIETVINALEHAPSAAAYEVSAPIPHSEIQVVVSQLN